MMAKIRGDAMPKTEPMIEAIGTVEDVGVEASEMAPE